MKNMIVAALLSLAACGVQSPASTEDPAERAATEAVGTDGVPADGASTCSLRSPPICAGVGIGTVCRLTPRLFCLPTNEAPDGSVFCGCQAQSTI